MKQHTQNPKHTSLLLANSPKVNPSEPVGHHHNDTTTITTQPEMGEKNCGTHKTQGRPSTIRQSELLTCVFFPKMTRILKSYLLLFFFSFVCFHLLKMQGALLIYVWRFFHHHQRQNNQQQQKNRLDSIMDWVSPNKKKVLMSKKKITK